MIVVSSDDILSPAKFTKYFVDYPLGKMQIANKSWTNWNKAPLRLWQMQLNFAMFCASSACDVSSEHLNYRKHPLVRALYRFHLYYHMQRILKRLQVSLLHEASFNAADNSYTNEEFFRVCEDYNVRHNPMRYGDEKFLSERCKMAGQLHRP